MLKDKVSQSLSGQEPPKINEKIDETQDVQAWLEKLAAKKNILAMTYLSLLKEASPEVKQFWFDSLKSSLASKEPEDE